MYPVFFLLKILLRFSVETIVSPSETPCLCRTPLVFHTSTFSKVSFSGGVWVQTAVVRKGLPYTLRHLVQLTAGIPSPQLRLWYKRVFFFFKKKEGLLAKLWTFFRVCVPFWDSSKLSSDIVKPLTGWLSANQPWHVCHAFFVFHFELCAWVLPGIVQVFFFFGSNVFYLYSEGRLPGPTLRCITESI